MLDIEGAQHVIYNYSSLPKHDEYALQELGESLQEAMNSGRLTALTVYRIGTLTGTVLKMDTATQKVHFQTKDRGLFKIHFLEIWSAESLEG
ncbi:YolD-like family protein [Paenibacillus sonchi]|uniref:YolD-like family protein n=1 Tax=Paenibacillus sonchi TaxID=373687 RepID=UPI001E3B2EB3|nr:YolD-like family protein [Paenibacillus sonchi]MCE3203392.1 YolD-like family protein [Paenibacillus sonchi]